MENNVLYKKDSIIFTTIDVINEYGMQAVSTKEVARRLGISEGSIFKYFPKKNDLILAVLEHFSLYDEDIFRTTSDKKMKPEEAIIFFIDTYLVYYENYPAITAVMQAYDLLRNVPVLGDKVKSIFNGRREFIAQIVNEAKQSGRILHTTDSALLADIILSTCEGICLKWRMNNYNFSLRNQTLQAIDMLLKAFGLLNPGKE